MALTDPPVVEADGQLALVEAARVGDSEAWGTLFDENFQALYRYCYYRVGNHHVAEELAAQVFEEALKGIKRFDYRGISLRAWFFRIARNVSADHLQKAARGGPSVTLLDFADSSDQVRMASDRADILSTLKQLTEEQQVVVTMRFLEDLSLQDCADVIGKTVDAVKSLQARGLQHMRQIMTQEGVADVAA